MLRAIWGIFVKKMALLCALMVIFFTGCTKAQPSPQITEIVTTFTANFALTATGDIYSWGKNEFGVLGLGDSSKEFIDIPTKVEIAEPVVKIISAPNSFTVLAITTSGNVYGWGSNRYKNISSEENAEYRLPVLVDYGISIKDIKLSHRLVTLLDSNGRIYGCGWSQEGSPIHIEARESLLNSDHYIKEIHLASDEPIKQFENADTYRAFLTTQGELFLQGTFVDEKILFPQPNQIQFPEPISQIGAMYQGLIALSETGKLYFIGEDRFGIVGNDSNEYYDLYKEPILINKIEGILDISVSSSSVIVQTNDGRLYTWGYNLGRNNAESSDEVIISPTQLDYNGKTQYYYCGEFSSVCITEENKVYVWGSNVYNLHLDSSLSSKYEPTQINLSTYIKGD